MEEIEGIILGSHGSPGVDAETVETVETAGIIGQTESASRIAKHRGSLRGLKM